MATCTNDAKSVRTQDSSSTVDTGPTIVQPLEVEAPPVQPPDNPQTAVVANNTAQARNSGNVFQQEWPTFVRFTIVLLSVASGCLGGFLRHDANLGLGIGAAVITGLLVIFEVLKHKLYHPERPLLSLPWWLVYYFY